MRSPGKTARCGACWIYRCALLSILPQDAVGGWIPRPKKLRADSMRMAFAIFMVAATMIVGMMFGRI